MGFKVTVHRNGAKHGEAHYSSEAVAVGMAKKMKNAGADVSVARCNGACCSSATANPRPAKAVTWTKTRLFITGAVPGDFARYRISTHGGTYAMKRVFRLMGKNDKPFGEFATLAAAKMAAEADFAGTKANPRRNGAKKYKPTPKPVNAAAVAAARALGQTAYARGIGSAPAQDPMLKPLIGSVSGDTSTLIAMLDAWTKEWHKAQRVATDADVAALGVFPKANPRRRRASTRAASDSLFALETKIRETEAMLPAAALQAARQESGWGGSGMVMATRSEMEAYLRELRRTLKANPRRRNGTTSANAAASRSLVHRAGLMWNRRR